MHWQTVENNVRLDIRETMVSGGVNALTLHCEECHLDILTLTKAEYPKYREAMSECRRVARVHAILSLDTHPRGL